jgi:hypothetical protein
LKNNAIILLFYTALPPPPSRALQNLKAQVYDLSWLLMIGRASRILGA